MSELLAQLVGVRSQTATAVMDALDTMATALDTTPWTWPDGRAILTTEVAVELRVFTRARPRVRDEDGGDRPGKEGPRRASQDGIDELDAERYELPKDVDRRDTRRWNAAVRRRGLLVITGAPGGGKSFMTRHTVVERLRAARADLDAGRVRVADTPAAVWMTATALAQAASKDLAQAHMA